MTASFSSWRRRTKSTTTRPTCSWRGFIGNPAMNLIRGDLVEGGFRAAEIHIQDLGPSRAGRSRAGVVLGVRSEDLTVVEPGEGDINAPIYSIELTGENTLVTVRVRQAAGHRPRRPFLPQRHRRSGRYQGQHRGTPICSTPASEQRNPRSSLSRLPLCPQSLTPTPILSPLG